MVCSGLLLTAWAWQRSPIVVWNFPGVTGWIVQAAYIGAWLGLMYSISLTGFGYQNGWTSWWPWIRGREVPRRPGAGAAPIDCCAILST